MNRMRMALVIMLIGIFMPLVPNTVWSQMEHKMPAGESKTADTIKATFKVTPSMNMIDVLLAYADTGREITTAKVLAVIKGPDGKVQEKELLGMKMGEDFSFMNTLDMSKKGRYSFAITVEVMKKKVKFDFVYEVK